MTMTMTLSDPTLHPRVQPVTAPAREAGESANTTDALPPSQDEEAHDWPWPRSGARARTPLAAKVIAGTAARGPRLCSHIDASCARVPAPWAVARWRLGEKNTRAVSRRHITQPSPWVSGRAPVRTRSRVQARLGLRGAEGPAEMSLSLSLSEKESESESEKNLISSASGLNMLTCSRLCMWG